MEENKKELIEQLNILKSYLANFIYPDYPNLEVYSKEYYNNIFLNFFSHTKKVFSFMYADFNKINKINQNFGNKAGDIALEIGHKLIRETFPNEDFICRVGGDELTGIFHNLNSEDTLNYVDELNKKLENFSKNFDNIFASIDKTTKSENSNLYYYNINIQDLEIINKIYGNEAFKNSLTNIKRILSHSLPQTVSIHMLDSSCFRIISKENLSDENLTEYQNEINEQIKNFISPLSVSITTSISDSTVADIRDLEHITEQDVAAQKHLRSIKKINKNEKDPWNILHTLITTAMENHLSDIRSSNQFVFDIENYKEESLSMIDTFIKRLEYDISTMNSINSTTNNISDLCEKDIKSDKNNIITDSKLASLVHSFLTSDELCLEDLNEIELSQMDDFISVLLERLTIHKDSKLLNKTYFKQYLAHEICNNKSHFQMVILSMAGIKLNNNAFGHHVTDEKISKTTSAIKNLLYENKTFNSQAFSYSNSDSYVIDYGGGDIIVLLDNKQKVNQLELDKILQKINSSYDSQDPNSSLLVAGTICDHIPTDDANTLIQFIRNAKQKCSQKKDLFKKGSSNSIAHRTAFQKSIEKPIQYYLKTIPNPNDIEQKRKFISMVFNSLLEHEVNHNLKARNNSDIEL